VHLSQANHHSSPPHVQIPRQYNAAYDLLQRNASRPNKLAYIDAISGQQLTYGELTDQCWRFANALRAQGFEPETRVMLCMLDTPNGWWRFWGACSRAWCPSPPTRC